MAMLHGTVGEFNIEREDWSAYAERLQQYFTANDVDSADKQRAVLLSACGLATYNHFGIWCPRANRVYAPSPS